MIELKHMNNNFLWKAFLVLIIVGVLDWVGIWLQLFWTVSWYDIPVHFLGGFWVGSMVVWFISQRKSQVSLSYRKLFVTVLAWTILVGLLWEVFELAIGVTSFLDGFNYVSDTSKDLLMDTLGGFLVAWINKSSLISNQFSDLK